MSVATIQAESTVAAKRPALAAMNTQVENRTMPLNMLYRSDQNVRARNRTRPMNIGVLAELISPSASLIRFPSWTTRKAMTTVFR